MELVALRLEEKYMARGQLLVPGIEEKVCPVFSCPLSDYGREMSGSRSVIDKHVLKGT